MLETACWQSGYREHLLTRFQIGKRATHGGLSLRFVSAYILLEEILSDAKLYRDCITFVGAHGQDQVWHQKCADEIGCKWQR